ncbi:MAG: ABC transporter ATP-binding protein [Desulfovibrio sp.]|jgi:iron complex transport system ATP-binding protein|nr:ABC transporter ATP-binding protein [Desulfovibrio sp.]
MLDVDGLVAGYGARRGFRPPEARDAVLHGIGLSARGGETIALLGPNGCGKTTLLRCLAGVLRPWEGNVRWDGRDLTSLAPKARARLVSVVPQRERLPEGMTAMSLVLLGRFSHLAWHGRYSTADREAAEAALADVGALEFADRNVSELSGGEVQRVLLARALAPGTPLLLLDELSAGLDVARMIELFDLLERQRRRGRCLVVAMHDCNLAGMYATRLVGMRDGRLLFDGPVETAFTEENLSALYAVPVHVFPHPALGIAQAVPGGGHGPRGASGDSASLGGGDG